MRYYLSKESVLRRLEKPSLYHIKKDDLYELDEHSFSFLNECGSEEGCSAENNTFIDYCLQEGILTKENASSKRPRSGRSPDPSLRYLELQITKRCNLRCKHCYIGFRSTTVRDQQSQRRRRAGGGEDGLSVEEIRRLLKEFDEMQGLRVLITGGEPLMHPDFQEINNMLPEFPFRKILFSNGLLLDGKILEQLNVEEIQISIDGLEQAHDALRGKGSFRSATKAIREARRCGFEVSVATMVHPLNLADFEAMERLFKHLGIKDWTVDIPCVTGRLAEHPSFHVSPSQGGKLLRYGYGKGLHSVAPGFACGLHLAAVTADGRVAKCTFYEDRPVGSIDEGLRKCWQRIRPVRLEQLACDCRYIESCRGGCRYRAELFGDSFGKDYYRCSLYDILEK